MSDIKKLLSKSEEAGKPTEGERELLIESLLHQSALHNRQGDTALALLFTSAAQELERLQEENAELKKKSEWISVDDFELHLKDGYLCFVYFPCGEIKKCHLNDYRGYGGNGVYWQDMHGEDLLMLNTKFIKIETPTPPKGE